MAWAVLLASGVLESVWALFLKASDGFTKLWPSVGFVVFGILSFVGLGYAMRSLPAGVAYAVWTGTGAALTAILAIVIFGEAVTVGKIVSLVLVVSGVVGLSIFGGDH